MRIAFFDTHRFDRDAFESAHVRFGKPHDLRFIEARLELATVPAAAGAVAVCAFVNDRLDAPVIEALSSLGIRLIALRSAGYNHVDLEACHAHGIVVTRVPSYSPHAVAEHALCLILALNRKIHRAYQRVRELNFSLDGLVGFDLYTRTVGVIGTGTIGITFAKIMKGIGCRVLAYDLHPDTTLTNFGIEYVALEQLLEGSDIISLHVPLNATTRHILNRDRLATTKRGVMIINTGRGGLIDSHALLDALRSGQVGSAGLDVYEREEGIFFKDHSSEGIADDVLARFLTLPNVLVTAHQAFLTQEALGNIAESTLTSVTQFERGEELVNQVKSA
jgi:D-lactate dehydrogenase